MADIIDQASDLETLERENSIARQRLQVKRAYSKDCVECGVHIPEERQEILGGTDLCVDCASMLVR
jgi:phage/conjugal plasmid C-4 type zinc finger TraR family protein